MTAALPHRPAVDRRRPTWTPSVWTPCAHREPFAPEMAFDLGNRLHHLATTAYPIGHRTTFAPYRVPAEDAQDRVASTFRQIERMGLYVHVPFCERRCRYCEYAVVRDPSPSWRSDYVQAVEEELDLVEGLTGRGKVLVGLDIGGGTPALLTPPQIERILARVDGIFTRGPGFLVSIETTPKIAAEEPMWLKMTRRLGVERISMGIQTDDPVLLAAMERRAGGTDANPVAAANIRRAGFSEFNVDVMYGFAGQSVGSWRQTLEHAISLGPDSITTYRVRYKGTRIEDQAAGVRLEDVNRLYETTVDVLPAAGYAAVPGKNTYSRLPGHHGLSPYLAERVHHGTPYLGVGLGAQSFTGNVLAYNSGAASKRLEPYLKAVRAGRLPLQDAYLLSREEGMAKMISVSFYSGGIRLAAFQELFGVSLPEQFPREVRFVLDNRLMELDPEALRLTHRGALACHGCMALFYSDAVKRHLADRLEEV